MNWKNRLLYTLLIGGLVTACDTFEQDVQPQGEQELSTKNSVYLLPGTELFIDLKKSVNSSGAVRVQLNLHPQSGAANITEDAILTYMPNPEFLTGQDLLSLNLLNQQGTVIDTDSVYIQMVQSTDRLPCNNGALSDYFQTPKNQTLYFDPTLNDGFCAGEIAEVSIVFISQPEHGQLLDSDSAFTYEYIPPTDYTGWATFMYGLEIVDHEGNPSYSLAQIDIMVFDETQAACDSMISPYHHVLEKPLEDYYIFEPYEPNPLCSVEWSTTIHDVTHGQAELTPDGKIKYFPGQASRDSITYDISSNGQVLYNYIIVQITDSANPQCLVPLEASDDEYYLRMSGDSAGMSNEPHFLDPVENDQHCTYDYTIRIVEEPTIGEVVVIDQRIRYSSSEEFIGVRETSMLYEICDQAECDTAVIHLTIDKSL